MAALCAGTFTAGDKCSRLFGDAHDAIRRDPLLDNGAKTVHDPRMQYCLLLLCCRSRLDHLIDRPQTDQVGDQWLDLGHEQLVRIALEMHVGEGAR